MLSAISQPALLIHFRMKLHFVVHVWHYAHIAHTHTQEEGNYVLYTP